MRPALPVGKGFSPLDEELGLLPGALSPWLHEALVHLGTWMPFAQAARELAFFTRVVVSEATATRATEAAGAAWVALQAAEVERLEGEQPEPPPGPPVQQVSADGALVPLVGGAWAEVKTVVIGTVETTIAANGERTVSTHERSYFSRLADAETFTRLALVELHRRGTETAGRVVAPMDGADWEQTFLDVHRPDAIRILDFSHALEHLATAAQATFGPGTAETSAWLEEQAHTLKHGDPDAVLGALRALPTERAKDPVEAERVRDATLHYLEKRREQIQYAAFQALGYPIGSGSVESANKLVVEARLKGSGMHWARPNVDALLALRTIACSDRWEAAWPQIETTLREQARSRRQARRRAKPLAPTPPPTPPRPPIPPATTRTRPLAPAAAPTIVNGRPTAEHPWKKYPVLPGRHSPAKS